MADLKTQIGCLASCIDANQEKAEACHWEMKAHQEKTEATVHSVQSKLEETIKHQVEDVLVSTKGCRAYAKNLMRRLMKRRWTYRQQRRASISRQRASRKL
jgi:hypothetical protein